MGALHAARQILGALNDAASAALRRLPGIAAPDGVRMADAGLWIAAAETAFGFPEEALVASIRAAQDELFVERIKGAVADPATRKSWSKTGSLKGMSANLINLAAVTRCTMRSPGLGLPGASGRPVNVTFQDSPAAR